MFNYVFGMESAILIEDCYFGLLFEESCHDCYHTNYTSLLSTYGTIYFRCLTRNIHPQMMVLIAKILKPIYVEKHPNFR